MTIDRSRLSACVLMAPSWDLAECIDGWERAGLAGIGITMGGIESVGHARAIELLASSSLAVANLQNLDPFDLVAPERFDTMLPRVLAQLDLAATIGADCIYALCGPRGPLTWDQAADRLVDQVERLLPHLHERNVRLAVEPIHPIRQDLSFVNTASDTAAVLERVQDPSIGYVYDFWHLWWQRDALEAARRTAGRVMSVQPSDHKAITLRTLDRAVPGAGIAPVGALVTALEEGGYRGFYDLEVLSPDNEERGYDRTIAESVSGFLAAVEGITP